jgi:hypothetical protein
MVRQHGDKPNEENARGAWHAHTSYMGQGVFWSRHNECGAFLTRVRGGVKRILSHLSGERTTASRQITLPSAALCNHTVMLPISRACAQG